MGLFLSCSDDQRHTKSFRLLVVVVDDDGCIVPALIIKRCLFEVVCIARSRRIYVRDFCLSLVQYKLVRGP